MIRTSCRSNVGSAVSPPAAAAPRAHASRRTTGRSNELPPLHSVAPIKAEVSKQTNSIVIPGDDASQPVGSDYVSVGSKPAGTGRPQELPGTSADSTIPDAVAAAAQWDCHVPKLSLL